MDIFKLVPEWAWQPKVFFLPISFAFFVVLYNDRLIRILVNPIVAWAAALATTAVFVLGTANPTFKAIISKGDNIPIIMMVYSFGYFTWLALRKGTINDDRADRGLPPLEEAEGHQKVMVWPDLVYVEFICLILVTVGLMVWSIVLKAPLEQPATRVETPNPSKAPWYFLGLQELLVYFDPWIAGVVLPGIIIVGLIAIPYIDNNPKGSGYYTLRDRRFAIAMFLYGFLIMWVLLIFVGTFLRGPNWNIFALGEEWTVHKVEVLNNVNFAEYFWVLGLNQPLPSNWIVRELPGFLFCAGFFVIGPVFLMCEPLGKLLETYLPLIGKTCASFFYFWKRMWVELGFVRYSILAILFLTMVFTVLKMITRWAFNLKYFVSIPEFFFNI
ncbi:MAG: hypothetical protein QGG53_11340 [Planctomycetota bacterium]|nr:hypothetical protein [Planctomycetota bacterium]